MTLVPSSNDNLAVWFGPTRAVFQEFHVASCFCALGLIHVIFAGNQTSAAAMISMIAPRELTAAIRATPKRL
jgi:hypothetical protein